MKMGDDYKQKMMEALASAHASLKIAPTGKTLHIKSGKPVNVFDPSAWAAAFTEFFLGDRAPNLGRPVPTSLVYIGGYIGALEAQERGTIHAHIGGYRNKYAKCHVDT